MRDVFLLPQRRDPTGSGDLHQTAGEIQREAQALHNVCMLLLLSTQRQEERQIIIIIILGHNIGNRRRQTVISN